MEEITIQRMERNEKKYKDNEIALCIEDYSEEKGAFVLLISLN